MTSNAAADGLDNLTTLHLSAELLLCSTLSERPPQWQAFAARTGGGEPMPRPPRACAEPGCGQPARHPHNRCEPHRLAKRKADDARRPNARQRGYDTRWQRTRAAYLAAHPTCECGCGQPATDVDHIDGLGPNGPLGHDPVNLMAMAHACHSRKTALHDGAFGRPRSVSTEHST